MPSGSPSFIKHYGADHPLRQHVNFALELQVAFVSTFEGIMIMRDRLFAGDELYVQVLNILDGPASANFMGLNGTTGLINFLPAFCGTKRWVGKISGQPVRQVTVNILACSRLPSSHPHHHGELHWALLS